MEQIEQADDDGQEIFQECDNFVTKELSLEKDQQERYQYFAHYKLSNNNQHVVHVGVIAVLLTIYLGVTSVQKCLVTCVENTSTTTEQAQEHILNYEYLHKSEKFDNTKILERLLEYKDICKDLEIFTKQQEKEKKNEEEKDIENDEDNINELLKDIEMGIAGIEESDDGSGSSGSGDCAKGDRNKPKKSKYSIKTTSTKNGFNKYNKSTKAKYQKSQKKDLNLNKKNSTAEPIIYLFALVFIYLLLKAASDINQHYKSQNKNDKRLRRCSLQSYAQAHRPDRRASKELALKQKQQQLQQRIKSLSRSSSQDHQIYHSTHLQQQQQQHQHQLIDGSPQKSSELKQQATTGTPPHSNVSYSSNWQLLRQHSTTQSLDNSDILTNTRGNAELSTSLMARRCSVPAALSYQRQKLSTASPLTTVNDHANLNVSLSRRTSIVLSPLPLTMDPNDSLITETKRRVRMINRH